MGQPAKNDQDINTIGHFIQGHHVAHTGRTQTVFNPANGTGESEVALASTDLVNRAVSSAQSAFAAWRATPPIKRARIMFRLKNLLEVNSEHICTLIAGEHGKVLDDAQGELQRGIENIEYACSAPELLKGEHSRNVGPGIDSWSEFQALGVVAGITPFNFPAMVPLWMWPLAVVCGNTFILKPSERVPSTAIYIAELAHEAGLPPGVLNVVNGDREAVDALIQDDRVQAISFVGSTPVAEHIYAEATARGKRVQALGGAKNHAIVMPDADIANTVDALIGAAYGSCGQRCMAISVAVAVGDDVANELASRLSEKIPAIKVGPGMQTGSDMGPLVTQQHLNKVLGYIESGIEEGADLTIDGRGVSVPGHESGYFLGPCLFDNVTPQMKIYREEIFGPVLCIVRVESLKEAIEIANAHEYGNGTCLFTRDGEAARYYSDNIQAGMVGINVPLPVPVSYHSFGGWKRSLFGDLSAYGPDGVRFYTRRKTITQRWTSSTVRDGVQFSFPSNS